MADLQDNVTRKESRDETPSKEDENAVPPKEGQDKGKKIILKVMRYDYRSNRRESIFFYEVSTTRLLETLTLKGIRDVLRKQDEMKNLKDARFCDGNGTVCQDDMHFGTYLSVTNGTMGTNKISVQLVYLKKSLVFGWPALEESEKTRLDLDTSKYNLKLPDIKSSLEHRNYVAAVGPAKVIHPMDLSECDWNIIMKNNNLLCGYRIKYREEAGHKFFPTGIERSVYPTFVLKKKELRTLRSLADWRK